jgi:CubicO group peptidase (beta-lactamase class C family)
MLKLLIAVLLAAVLMAGCASQAGIAEVRATDTPQVTVGEPTATPSPAPLTVEQAVDEFIAPLVNGYFSGAILIAQGDTILVSKGYGMANLEYDIPNTPQTKFRIASMTKQFTAMAILMLQEQGKLNVQGSICEYLPDCLEAWRPITIHHLLTHTSGLPGAIPSPEYEGDSFPFLSEMVIEKLEDSPLYPPGERFSYSNAGYFLLGYIIEKVSGKSYEVYLQDNIFQPLNMVNTGLEKNESVLKKRASGYQLGLYGLQQAAYTDMRIPYAAGGLYSTVEDLYLWDRALYTEKLVSQSSLNLIFTPVDAPGLSDWKYGYGWDVGKINDHAMVGHGGNINGFITDIRRFVDDDMVVIVLSNIENAPMWDKIAPGLWKIALSNLEE